MAWYTGILNKLNPAQPYIVEDQGSDFGSNIVAYTYQQAYDKIEAVNRGCNFLTDSAADIPVDVGKRLNNTTMNTTAVKLRKTKLDKLINYSPNPYISADEFKRNVFLDLILDGNAFIYFDGAFLYNLPANNVIVHSDKKTFVRGYTYSGKSFKSEEIIHIRDNSSSNIFRGTSRLKSAGDSITILQHMISYQTNFFKNNAIPGIVLSTPNTMSSKLKARRIKEWRVDYAISGGGARSPMILDGDFKLDNLTKSTYSDLDFEAGVTTKEEKILKAIGVPPILLDTGNNANVTPNLKLFYLTTVLPLVNKYISSLERYFGYDLKAVTQDIQALRPELKDQASYLTALTNAGIMKREEAREKIRLPASGDPEADKLIVPANVAGSAVNPAQGGKPPSEPEDKK